MKSYPESEKSEVRAISASVHIHNAQTMGTYY